MAKKELSRDEVAQRLGCSVWQVFKLESEGRLTVRREKLEGKKRERVWYDADQVMTFLNEYTPMRKSKLRIDSELVKTNVRGQIAALAMPLFEEKRTLVEERAMLAQICTLTKADPLIIQQMYEQWRGGFTGNARAREREKKEAILRADNRLHENRERQREYVEAKERIAKLEARAAEAKLEAVKKMAELEAKKTRGAPPEDERKQA